MELAEHRRFRDATDIAVYFCDPWRPWQRGSTENTNGLLHQYFPKGTDQSGYSSPKTEHSAFKVYRTRDDAKPDVFDYIERLYNPRRRKSTPRHLNPAEYEQQTKLAQFGVNRTGNSSYGPSNDTRIMAEVGARGRQKDLALSCA